MKDIKLTKKQELVLNFIKEYTAKHGFPPAVREIAKGVGLNSPSSVHSHIKRLERDGFIKKTSSKFRTLEVVGKNEFKTDDTKSIKLPIYHGNSIAKTNGTIDFPSSRIPKNVEPFAYKIESNFESFNKDDILILIKPKIIGKFDTLLILDDNEVKTYIVNDKNDLDKKDITIIGKILELIRFY